MAEEFAQDISVTELRIGFGRRLGALLIDAVIIAALAAGVYTIAHDTFEKLLSTYISHQLQEQSVALSELDGEQADAIMDFTTAGIVWGFIAGSLALLYSLMEIAYGATLGKMALGIKIANADATTASTGTLATRWFIKSGLASLLNLLATLTAASILSTLATIVGIVIFIGCFFVLGANRQALHDMIAKTAVYRRRDIRQVSPELV
ncbi:MAG: hypothetical protein KatS3mg040_1412 [Candidatus Kapaibacterium sp.]|nr:MAG: hypothetical protein KatS3mg040_1412 [Candidatus Kapabacteria bacterium]